jgi:hypothetical protein
MALDELLGDHTLVRARYAQLQAHGQLGHGLEEARRPEIDAGRRDVDGLETGDRTIRVAARIEVQQQRQMCIDPLCAPSLGWIDHGRSPSGTGAANRPVPPGAGPSALLLLVAVLAQPLLALVGGDLLALALASIRHGLGTFRAVFQLRQGP